MSESDAVALLAMVACLVLGYGLGVTHERRRSRVLMTMVEALSDPARFTPVEKGKADGSA
jgi:hypothetical protein